MHSGPIRRDTISTFRTSDSERARADAGERHGDAGEHNGQLRRLSGARMRSKWLIVVALPSIAVLATLLMAFMLPPSYTAKASLLVSFGREYVFRPMVGASESILPWRPETIINSELEILNSDDLKRQIVEVTGPEELIASPSEFMTGSPVRAQEVVKAVETLRSGLSLKGVKDSNVIQVYFRHSDPAVAARVLDLLLAGYLERRAVIYSTQGVAFLADLVASGERDLEAATRAQEEFKRGNKLVRYEEERVTLAQREATLLNERDVLQRNLVEAKGERRVYEPLRGADSLDLAQIEARISGTTAALEEVDTLLKTTRARLDELEASKPDLDRLAAAVARAQKRLEDSQARLAESKLSEALDRSRLSNVKIVEAPRPPDRKDGLTLTTRIGIAVIVGLMAAFGLIILLTRPAEEPTRADLRNARKPTIV